MTLTPKKSLGQNFLVDRNIAAKIVREIAPEPGEVIVEIGPGEGALTEGLVESGCRLVAVEIDPRAAAVVRERWGDRVEVIESDVLKLDLASVARERQVERLRVVGNIPYYITSPILFHLFEHRAAVREATLMMQREVADRLVAVPRTKEYGILAVMTQSYALPRRLFDVGSRSFRPQPKVTSAVVRLAMRDIEGIAGIERAHRAIVRTAFNQRRKTLRNALTPLLQTETERDTIFSGAGINPGARAEELRPEDFVRLARVYASAVARGGGAADT